LNHSIQHALKEIGADAGFYKTIPLFDKNREAQFASAAGNAAA
jgi:hypothetical protein